MHPPARRNGDGGLFSFSATLSIRLLSCIGTAFLSDVFFGHWTVEVEEKEEVDLETDLYSQDRTLPPFV